MGNTNISLFKADISKHQKLGKYSFDKFKISFLAIMHTSLWSYYLRFNIPPTTNSLYSGIVGAEAALEIITEIVKNEYWCH